MECTGTDFESWAYSSRCDRDSPPLLFSRSFLLVHRFLLSTWDENRQFVILRTRKNENEAGRRLRYTR